MRLTLLHFFIGGFALQVAAFWLFAGASTFYDGGLTTAGTLVSAVVIALASVIAAMAVGLPVRLVPGIRSQWIANGEVTVVGAVLGLLGCIVVMAVAPVHTVTDELGAYAVRDYNGWALLAAWCVLTLSVAHFVWPRRWLRKRPLTRHA
jgi:hypothetical protein